MGDEAILISELLFLRKKLKDAEFYILSFGPERTLKLTAGISEVKKILRMGSKRHVVKSEFFSILKTFREVDLVVIGGGGIFQDIYNHYPIPFFTAMALLSKLHRKQLVLYCLGIGPINTTIGKALCKLTATMADIVSVRDSTSMDVLKNIGVSREIHLSADPVFLLEPLRNEKTKEVTERINNICSGRPVIGVCVQELFDWGDGNREILADTLDTLIADKGAQVVFLPYGDYKDGWMSKSTSDPVDISASKKLISLMKEESCIITDGLLPQELLAVMERMDIVISMRLHGLIMGLNRGIPVIALTYKKESKLLNLMKRIGHEDMVFNIEDIDRSQLLEKIDHVFLEKDDVKKHIQLSVSSLQDEWESNNELMFQTVLANTMRGQL